MQAAFNYSLFHLVKAPPDLAGAALRLPVAIADWAIFAGPAILILLWSCGAANERRAAVRACIAAITGLGTAAIISALYFHPRPFMDGGARNYLHHVADSSFPSDHATVLFALAFSLIFGPLRRLRLAGLTLLTLALSVSWARVYLGAHYPFDVLGGAGIGFMYALAFAHRPLRDVSDRLSDFAHRRIASLLVGPVCRR